VDAYTDHTWIIGTNIPEDIAAGKSFVISDTLDSRLDYVGNVKVNVETADGRSVVTTLTEGEDYTLNVTDADSLAEGNPSDAFTVTLTSIGMSKVSNSVGSNRFDDYMLRVYFDAQINANAQMGTEIPNKATVDYTNSVNFDFSAGSDKPVVYTGGARLLKVDAADETKVLPGAVFEVYRLATSEEVAAGGDALKHIPGVSAPVVRVSFFDNEDLAGEKVTSVTSDADGNVKVYGLAYGEYFLLETKAPAGYNLLKEAAQLPIDGTTHTVEKTVTVKNVNGTQLPATGGMGTHIYIITGFALLCASGLLLVSRKRKTY
jgi:fimbrial isopeptide formation D2 family protein/LPXTG-motif cell wall-anchored protein